MSSFRRTSTNNPGDNILYGSNDLHVIIDLLNGANTTSPPVIIKSTSNKFKFFDNVLQFRNTGDTFNLTIRNPSSLSANRDLTLPSIAVNDTLAALLLTQTFFNKTINLTDNVLTDTSAANGEIIVHNGTKYVRLAAGTTSQFLRGDGTWQLPPGAAGGEANTGANVNVGGVGVFKQKSGLELQFRGINILSNKLSVALDSTNNEIDLDVVEANLTLSNIGGTLSIAKGGTGQTSMTNAFDALAPTTTEGDIIYRNANDNVRLAKGTALQYLRMNAGATAPEWATLSSAANSGTIIGDYVSGGYMYAWLYPTAHTTSPLSLHGFLSGEDSSGVKNDVTTNNVTMAYDATATRGHHFLLTGVDNGSEGWMRLGINSLPFQRRYSPFVDFWFRFRQSPLEGRAMFMFTGDTSPATTDTTLNTESGFGMMIQSTNESIVPVYNDADATQDLGTSIGTESTSMVHARIELDEANTKGVITLNGVANNYTFGTIDPPAATTPMYFWINVDEATGVADQLLEIYRPYCGVKIP